MAGERPRRWLSPAGVLTVAAVLPVLAAASLQEPAAAQDPAPASARPVFATSDQCIACHSNIVDDTGADISIGHAWRATMMANSARDPYWQAGVRRESMDNPALQSAIEDTCATCHMPMARTAARADGRMGEVFAHTGLRADASAETAQAWDGVSCTVCHQIAADNFGEHESFDGGYVIATGPAPDADGPALFGPFDDVEEGLEGVMHSATGYVPAHGAHVQESELCATCHTLFTTAYDDDGNALEGRFPEQAPYLEWDQSRYREEESCQDCHMPAVDSAPISSVLGEDRDGVSQHRFRGGNAFMLRMLNRYRDELQVTAPAAELELAADLTEEHLRTETAEFGSLDIRFDGATVTVDVDVRNLAGHKLPTAYPSRRAWIHLTARDQAGRTIFESGAPQPDGSIAGNANDTDAAAFEPHYTEITAADQVQIYEPIIGDSDGNVTTALLRGVRYLKDNRLLPEGFDKAVVDEDVAVRGNAAGDADFTGGGDRVRYRIEVGDGVTSVTVTARLLFQTIGYRWARNLADYDAFETNRFVGYYEADAEGSVMVLAESSAEGRR